MMDNICKSIIDKNVEDFHVYKIKEAFSQFLYVFVYVFADIMLRFSNELFITELNIQY